MIVKEIYAKTILSKSKVSDYTINPYIGCEHGCTYCYARFMKRYTGHREKWGRFVDVKVNAAKLLQHEIKKKQPGKVWISGVCDPYQPIERKYELTRDCLRILSKYGWPITIQTKSPLVKRDLALLRTFNDIKVGLTITTADEEVRKVFEPVCPPIKDRIETLEILHSAGLKTFAMMAPLLPKAEGLVTLLRGSVDYVLIDKMNYHYADWIYKKYGLEYAMTDVFFAQKKRELSKSLEREDIPFQIFF
ncbi:MAG: radical SAM protein [Candidatus Bathyarchaeota archaeon]|nr:radical SAM protein [Candidatus Bathyarchaeota archaeon]MDH5733619.1 radical SAM protein [Candidatus Bathyarchaeota archaeon]